MSKVSAMARPAFGIAPKTCVDPAATRLPARQPDATGAGVRVGGGVGARVGIGVAFGSAETMSSQPACSVPGSASCG